jgi:hypothetical protein
MKPSIPYEARFRKGDRIRIQPRDALEQFMAEWKYHHPLAPEQLVFAGRTAIVKSIAYYHGGDVIYELENVPGMWHEVNVMAEQQPLSTNAPPSP